MRTFAIGDIHGAYPALLECLKLSRFDRSQDRLICLGDVCDRGPQVKECIDELLTIPHCVMVLGNHDAWSLEWMVYGKKPEEWLSQGGAATIRSYKKTGVPKEHIRFLTDALTYYVDQNRLFVHAGFDPAVPIEENPKDILLWDRSLIKKAQELKYSDPNYKFGPYDEIYVGHTPTIKSGYQQPQQYCNIWAMDTGAGWGARLTIMDVATKQFWQSSVI